MKSIDDMDERLYISLGFCFNLLLNENEVMMLLLAALEFQHFISSNALNIVKRYLRNRVISGL